MTERRAVAPNLFIETANGPRLVGSRCASCGTPYFPTTLVCHNPDCSASRIEDATFGPKGTLWSFAVQGYAPPAPARFDQPYAPYAMGVVDLDEGLRVLGRIMVDDPERLAVGDPVELTLDTLCHEPDGSEVITWKFRPVGGR